MKKFFMLLAILTFFSIPPKLALCSEFIDLRGVLLGANFPKKVLYLDQDSSRRLNLFWDGSSFFYSVEGDEISPSRFVELNKNKWVNLKCYINAKKKLILVEVRELDPEF